MPATLLKKRLWHRCFPAKTAKFLRTPVFIEHLRWLLLTVNSSWKYAIILFYVTLSISSSRFSFFIQLHMEAYRGSVGEISSLKARIFV